MHTDSTRHEGAMVPDKVLCSCFCGYDVAVFSYSGDATTALNGMCSNYSLTAVCRTSLRMGTVSLLEFKVQS